MKSLFSHRYRRNEECPFCGYMVSLACKGDMDQEHRLLEETETGQCPNCGEFMFTRILTFLTTEIRDDDIQF